MGFLNLFLEMEESKLRELYPLYLEWNKSGKLGDNELGKIRDAYCDMIQFSPLVVMELDFLRAIAIKFIGKN